MPNKITNGRYLTIEEKPNGAVVKLTPEGREACEEQRISGVVPVPDYVVFADLFDCPALLGGGWAHLNAAELGGLTACEIIISPDCERDDEGDIVQADTVYWHERYQVEDAIEQLLAGGLFLLKA